MIKVVIKLVFSVFLYFSASAKVPFIVIDHMEREIGLSKKISSRSRKAELHDYFQTNLQLDYEPEFSTSR